MDRRCSAFGLILLIAVAAVPSAPPVVPLSTGQDGITRLVAGDTLDVTVGGAGGIDPAGLM